MGTHSKSAHPGPARRRRVDPGWVALIILFLISLPLVLPRLYASDSVKYFSYLHSLIFDGDLDFTNEYTYFMELNPQAISEGILKRDTTTDLPLNDAPVGTALLWAPAYLLTHGGVLLANALGAPIAADGLSRPYLQAVCYTSTAYAFAGLLLSYRLCRRFFSPFASALSVALIWLATPAFFYSHANPPWSHSASLFAVALFVNVWYSTRKKRTPAQFFLLGLLGGLVALVREQDGLLLLLPALEGLLAYIHILRSPAQDLQTSRGAALLALLGRHALLLGGVILAFSPQLAVYRVLNGRFAPNPAVSGKFTWWSPHFFQVLGDPHYGLLVWSPLTILALTGLFLLLRRDRLLVAALGLAFLAQVYIVGSFLTWQGLGSFGLRRFINCTIIFALGLAALITWAREKRVPAWALVVLGGLFVAWNAGLMANWVLYPEDRQAGLVWEHLPQRIFWEIPRQGPDFVRRLLFERRGLFENPGG